MPAGFRFIEQYRNMARDLEHEAGNMVSVFDQEVPQSKHFSQEIDIKPQIKLEDVDTQPDLFSMMESIINNDSTCSSGSINESTSTKNCSMFYVNSNQRNNFLSTDSQIKHSSSALIPSTSSSFFSSSPIPMMSSAINIPSSASSAVGTNFKSSPILSSRANTFLTEYGGNGCNLASSTDFLIDNNSTTPGVPEDSLEYTDLDKQQMSLYDGYSFVTDTSKTGILPDQSKRLEEAVIFMRDTIYNDCDNLKIPYNPMMWTAEHVRKWVSWVCQRNNVLDVSSYLYNFDGSTLCAMDQDTFSIICGDAGSKLCNELELWKAANSCFPNQMYSTSSNSQTSFNPQHLHNPFMDSPQTFSLPPCVSPALSSCSSTHDSNTSTASTHSDHSDEESVYGSQSSHNSTSATFGAPGGYNKILTKIPTGRGHKQTIHLWQFLKELLLSKDSNCGDCIRWLDRKAGVFKIEDSKKVASLWGARKNRPAMNYDKLSRSVRQYYKKGIIKKTEQSKRLVYQFCAGYL